MMKVMDKFLNMIGFEEEEGAEEAPVTTERKELKDKVRRVPLVSLPGNQAQKGGLHVVVAYPTDGRDVQEIADQLKGRRPVIVNLEGITKSEAQPILDFLAGAVYALDGRLERVGTGIFLVTPANVEVQMDEAAPAEETPKREANYFGA